MLYKPGIQKRFPLFKKEVVYIVTSIRSNFILFQSQNGRRNNNGANLKAIFKNFVHSYII